MVVSDKMFEVNVTVGIVKLEQVNSYKYLGIVITLKGTQIIAII